MGEVSRRSDVPAPVSVDPATLPTLEVDELVKEPEALLIARATAYGREYKRIEGQSTTLLKNIAAVSVALRVQHGDMRGSSNEYRQKIAQIYRDSGVDEKTQGSVRYHIGNLLRRTMTARELEQHSLLSTSPRERIQDNRATTAQLASAAKAIAAATDRSVLDGFIPAPPPRTSKPKKAEKGAPASKGKAPKSTGPEIKATADLLRLASVAGGIIGQLDVDVITGHMTAGQRAKLDEELTAMQKHLTALRRHTRKPSTKA